MAREVAGFLVDDAKLDRVAAVIAEHWPAEIAQDQIADPALIDRITAARMALLNMLDLPDFLSG